MMESILRKIYLGEYHAAEQRTIPDKNYKEAYNEARKVTQTIIDLLESKGVENAISRQFQKRYKIRI